jgi:hypothetical protein
LLCIFNLNGKPTIHFIEIFRKTKIRLIENVK